MGRPLRQQAVDQADEVLATGSAPTSQVPMIQRALEQVLMAGSKSRSDAEGRVSAAGIGRTPQGTRALIDVDFMNALNAAMVPSAVGNDIINRGMGVSMGQLQPGLGGLGTVAGTQGQVRSSQIGAEAQIISSMMQMFGQMMSVPPATG